MADTYTAQLIGHEGTESVELDFIDGLPQKSFVRATPGEFDGDAEEVVWELDLGAEGFVYRSAGTPGEDYS